MLEQQKPIARQIAHVCVIARGVASKYPAEMRPPQAESRVIGVVVLVRMRMMTAMVGGPGQRGILNAGRTEEKKEGRDAARAAVTGVRTDGGIRR
jgi:hypothetical protein